MGSWQLEVFRMFLYISFPVGMFHYFNHSNYIKDNFEAEWRKFIPSGFDENIKELTNFTEEVARSTEEKRLKKLEETYSNK